MSTGSRRHPGNTSMGGAQEETTGSHPIACAMHRHRLGPPGKVTTDIPWR